MPDGISLKLMYVASYEFTGEPVYRYGLEATEKMVDEYFEKHPFPESEKFGKEELKTAMTIGEDPMVFTEGITKEQLCYIEEFLTYFHKKSVGEDPDE